MSWSVLRLATHAAVGLAAPNPPPESAQSLAAAAEYP
jgi:hypothetical protein